MDAIETERRLIELLEYFVIRAHVHLTNKEVQQEAFDLIKQLKEKQDE